MLRGARPPRAAVLLNAGADADARPDGRAERRPHAVADARADAQAGAACRRTCLQTCASTATEGRRISRGILFAAYQHISYKKYKYLVIK